MASVFSIGRKQRAVDVLRRRHVPRRLIYRIPIAAVLLRSVGPAAGKGRPDFVRRRDRAVWTGPPAEYSNDLYLEPHLYYRGVYPSLALIQSNTVVP